MSKCTITNADDLLNRIIDTLKEAERTSSSLMLPVEVNDQMLNLTIAPGTPALVLFERAMAELPRGIATHFMIVGLIELHVEKTYLTYDLDAANKKIAELTKQVAPQN